MSEKTKMEVLAVLVNQLPLNVRVNMNFEVLERAVRSGLITVEDGHLQWMSGNNTLLAYFCGKMWCGDKGQYCRRKSRHVWIWGNGSFPAAALNRLFDVTTLKQTRARRRNLPLPDCWEIVDNLWNDL